MLKDLWRRFLAEFVDLYRHKVLGKSQKTRLTRTIMIYLIIGHVEFLNHCESAGERLVETSKACKEDYLSFTGADGKVFYKAQKKS